MPMGIIGKIYFTSIAGAVRLVSVICPGLSWVSRNVTSQRFSNELPIIRLTNASHQWKERGVNGKRTRHRGGGVGPRSAANLVDRSQVPGSPRQQRAETLQQCPMVAESAQRQYPPPALSSFRPDGEGVQLRGRIQEPRPGRRGAGPACADDGLARVVAGGLRTLWAAVHPHGVAQRRHLSHRRWPWRSWLRRTAFRAAQ